MTKLSSSMCSFGLILSLALAGCNCPDDRIKACYERRSNAEQRDCLHDLYRTASAELDQIYRRSVDRATALEADARARNTWPPPSGNRPSSAERITASQKAWEAYRDAECWGVVGEPGGSGSTTWAYGCLAEKTFERIGELKVPYVQR